MDIHRTQLLEGSARLAVLTALCVACVPTQAQQERRKPFRPVKVVAERPAIEHAPVINARDVQDEVTDGELVLGVVAGGEARAYPINMLTGPAREIINDTLGGKGIAAT
jgi:hypothetical protein